MSSSRVCVTGASGFIALHLVKQLLQKGYHVRAAVRGGGSSKLAPLRTMLESSSSDHGARLEIVESCELLRPGAFDEAVRGKSANGKACATVTRLSWTIPANEHSATLFATVRRCAPPHREKRLLLLTIVLLCSKKRGR